MFVEVEFEEDDSYNISMLSNDEMGAEINESIESVSGGAVQSVNGQTGDVVLNASDVGALPNTTIIPPAYDDTGIRNRVSTIEGKESVWNGKQDAIDDLDTIREGAALGSTALQSFSEQDPTVPSWAKHSEKPTYTASEVGALPADTVIPEVPTSEIEANTSARHTHSNSTVLDGITSWKVSAWDNKQNALTDTDKQAIADLHHDAVTSVNGMTGDVVVSSGGGISPEIQAAINANTAARHTHSNASVLDAITSAPVMVESDPTVPSWAKQTNKPSYTAAEVGALPADTVIPTVPTSEISANTSARHTHSNKSILDGITQTPIYEHQDISGKADADHNHDGRYVQEETDPTVPSWAKAETKPTYTAEEVGALPADTVIPAPTHFGITEDMFTLTTTATKGVSPYSTSYYYTDITIDPSSGVRWVEGATYSFVLDTKVATSSYRNVRVRIGEDDSWHPLCEYTTSICSGSNYFAKAMTVVFVYKTTHYSYGALHRLYDANSNTYIATCETAAGTAAKTATGTYPWAVLTAGLTAPIIFRYANTAKANVTLNWNSKGAVPLWLNGAEISTDNYNIPVGCWNCYYDGTKWHVRTDGKNANPDLNVTVPTADIEANTSARHTHDNKEVLDGITSDKVAKWDEDEVIQVFTTDDDNVVSLYTPSELASLSSNGKVFASGSSILEYSPAYDDSFNETAVLFAISNFNGIGFSAIVHEDKSVTMSSITLANTVDAVNGLIDAKLEALGTAEGESY